MPVPVAERSKKSVYGPSLAGIAGSNSAWNMHVCLLLNVVCYHAEVSATSRSLVQSSPTDCGVSLCVISKPSRLGGPAPRWAVAGYVMT